MKLLIADSCGITECDLALLGIELEFSDRIFLIILMLYIARLKRLVLA